VALPFLAPVPHTNAVDRRTLLLGSDTAQTREIERLLRSAGATVTRRRPDEAFTDLGDHHSTELVVIELESVERAALLAHLRDRFPAAPMLAVCTRELPATLLLDGLLEDFVRADALREELAIRWAMALRRHERATRGDEPGNELVLDAVRHAVSFAGRSVTLSRREFQLLECLLRASPRVVSRETLHEVVWADEYQRRGATRRTNVLEVYVSYLRRKLREIGCPQALKTVRRVGYALEQPPIEG